MSINFDLVGTKNPFSQRKYVNPFVRLKNLNSIKEKLSFNKEFFKKIVGTALIIILSYVFYKSVMRLSVVIHSFNKITEAENQLAKLKTENEDLKSKVETTLSESYLINEAYIHLNLAAPNSEKLLIKPAKTYEQKKQEIKEAEANTLESILKEKSMWQEILEFIGLN